MNLNPTSNISRPHHRGQGRRAAFSLIEIIVVVGLMSFIILGLMQMFNQTQRAYKLGTTQVDVLEGGRAVIDMMTRELSQMKPTRANDTTNFYARVSFVGGYQPLLQELPGVPNPVNAPSLKRTNIIEQMFFLMEENQIWTAIGYFVDTPNDGVGALYRYEYKSNFGDNPWFLFRRYYLDVADFYTHQATNNMTRLLEGVVHLRARAYNTNGYWITDSFAKLTDAFTGQIVGTNGFVIAPYTKSYLAPIFSLGEVDTYAFKSNAVPASVDLELGVLEDAALAKIKALYNPANAAAQTDSRRNYITNQAARTHLFRIRVPIRNVDPTAYQ